MSTQKNQKSNEMEIDDKPIVNLNLSLDILTQITSFQNQNGIRLKDYNRYINFLRKKINKLRQIFKITQGKKKFNKIEIEASIVQDPKVLMILLLECERKWAIGAWYNQRLTTIDQIVSEWRYTVKQKFKKAAELANKILEISRLRCDNLTVLESDAYYNTLQANYYVYVRNYTGALECYRNAKSIYSSIISKKDSIEAIVYKDRLAYLQMQVRLCEYNLKSHGEKEDVFYGETMDIETMESNLLEDTRSETSKPTTEQYEVKYHGTTIPIKNEHLKSKYLKINELLQRVDEESDLAKKQNIFSDVFNLADDCIKIIKSEKAKEGTGDNIQKILQKLINYTQHNKIVFHIQKTFIYIDDYKQDFNEKAIANIIEKDNVKLRAKPQDMIKLYDNLLQYYEQLSSLERENPDENFFIFLDYKRKVTTACKSFYAGVFYLYNKRYEECNTLVHFLKEKINECRQFAEMHKVTSVNDRLILSLSSELDLLENIASYILQKVFVRMSLEGANSLIEKSTDF